MAFNLGSFQTFGERLGRIEALKKAWQVANVSPLDIPGVRGAVKKALPKPLEGPAQFALGQFSPLNAGLIAAGILVPPLGVMGAAGRSASIGARIAPELRVAGTSLLGAYGGQQAGQLAERELGIPGAGLVGSLAGGVGGASYGMKQLVRPPTPGMAKFDLFHAGDVEGIAKTGGLMSREQLKGTTRGLGPPSPMTVSTGTVAANARIIERETARMQVMVRGSDEQITKLLRDLQQEDPGGFSFVSDNIGINDAPSRVKFFKAYLHNRGLGGGDLDPQFIGDPDEIVKDFIKGVPGTVKLATVADTEKILTAQLVHKVKVWTSVQDESGAQTLFKEWRNNPKTLKFLRKMFNTEDVDQAVDEWSRFAYQTDSAAGLTYDLYYTINRNLRFSVDDMVAAILGRNPNRATNILRSTVKELDPPLVAASKMGLEYQLTRLAGEPPIPVSKVMSVSGELPDEAVIKMVEDVGYDNVPANVQGQYDELTMAGSESAFTNQPSSKLFKARGLRDDALARARALGFDPRSPRKPGETPDMAALRDEFHRLNKQVGDIQRGMSDRPVADLPPEFKIGGAADNADALIAEGDALMAEGRQALAAEKYRQALGMVQGGGGGRIPPTIEGPGTFGEGFELGPGGGPPPGARQPSLGGELTPPPLKYEFDLGAELSSLANLPRVLLVSVLDFSGTMRQLFPAWAGKPSLLPKLMARQWGSMWNEETSAAFRARLTTNRNVQRLQQEGGLHIATDSATAEEPYLLATKDTWIHRMIEKFTPVRVTERAYTDATNMARQELVDKYYAPWPESWKADPVKSKRMGSLINELTGRGDIKALSKLAPWMNTVLFSPRLMWSRLKLPLRVVDLRHPEMRQILARHLAGTYGSMVAMAGILTMAGVTVELDPRSANFMKARIGNTRVDMTAGFGPIWRYMATMATGERKTETGDIVSAPLGETAWRLLRSKMSPTAGLVTDVIGGETFEGRELTLSGTSIGEQAKNSLMPLLWQDTIDAMKEEGLIVGVGAGVGSFLGVGVQTYPETPQSKLRARFQEKYGKEYEAGVDNVLVETDPELSALAVESQRYRLERGGEGAISKEKRTREFAQREQDFNLPMLAEGVLSGDPAAGSQFVEQFERYQQNIADVTYHEFFEDELDVGPTTLARDFDTWRKVTPEQYRDPATFEIDWETYFKTKEAAFARLPEEYRNAIEVRTRSQDPTVKQVETKFKQARTLRRQYFDLPKWVPQVGSTTDQDQIQEIQEAAQVKNQQLASQGYTDVDMKTVYGLVFETGQYDQRLVGLAFALRSDTKESQLYANPARQEFLLKHVSTLQLFYPDMYRSEQLLAQVGAQDGRNTARAFAS